MHNGREWSWFAAALLFVQAAAPTTTGVTVLAIDPAASHVVIQVGKAGMFGFAGHNHEVVAPAVRGTVTLDAADLQRSSVSLEFDTAALSVTGAGDPPADVPKVQSVMESNQVLDVRRFPTVGFRSRRVSVTRRAGTTADLAIEGDLTLHGVTRPTTVRVSATLDGGGLTARGNFSITQTAFNMVPVTAAGGTIRAKDEVDVQFVLEAHSR
jgi:polyisoprenoid-binding protein YceI